jgi:Rrf2 family transcriptional regulator, nitric oxide-sensitive transcriptional repressor
MRLQKSSLIALYAVLELASAPERQMATAEIAEKYGVSGHHLAKVMRTLVRAGLIQSVRGAGGGYRFAANAARTTLFDVIALFESLEPEIEPALAKAVRATPIGAAVQAISVETDELALATFKSVTLKSLLRFAPQIDPNPA